MQICALERVLCLASGFPSAREAKGTDRKLLSCRQPKTEARSRVTAHTGPSRDIQEAEAGLLGTSVALGTHGQGSLRNDPTTGQSDDSILWLA